MASWKKMLTTGSSTTDLSDVDNTAADAAGELLIWNDTSSSFVPNTLTAGTGISITNADGSVTIANTVTNTNTNIYNSDGTLSDNRTIDLDGSKLAFNSGLVSGVAGITANGSEFRRRITAKGYTTGPGTLLLNNSDNTHGVIINAPGSLSASYTLTLPTTNGDADQVLTTDGNGNLSWEANNGTDTNLGNTDQTLSADRTIDMSSNDLIFENSSIEYARISSVGAITGTRTVQVDGRPNGSGRVKLGDVASDNYVTLTAPSVMTSDLDLTLPAEDGTSGQFLQTDGSGTLSFEDDRAFPKPFAVLSGRFQFDSDDGNRTIMCGSPSFGTNYYLWRDELFDTVKNGTIDTTTQDISLLNSGSSLSVPDAGKVYWISQVRSINSNSYAKDFIAQIWSASSIPTSGSNLAWTLRGQTSFTSLSNTKGWLRVIVETTSEIPNGHYVLFSVGLDDELLSGTTYLSLQGTVKLTK